MSAVPDDITLLIAFQKGEPHAENAVFKRYFRPLCLYSERITTQTGESEDIVAEAFERAWDKRAEFQTLDNLKGFLYRAVRNASINYTIAEKRHRVAFARIGYATQQTEEPDNVLNNEILRVELLQEIYQEIENLPDRCGQIFKLLFIQGLTTEQIANRLSIHPQTVRTQKARAIQLLRTQLLRKDRLLTWLLLYTIAEKY